MKQDVLRTLFAALGIAILFVAWLKPEAPLSPLEGVALVTMLQLAAFGAARWLTPYNKPRLFVKALVSAFLFAGATILVLRPSVAVSFDDLFLSVAMVELGAIGAAGALTRSKPAAAHGE